MVPSFMNLPYCGVMASAFCERNVPCIFCMIACPFQVILTITGWYWSHIQANQMGKFHGRAVWKAAATFTWAEGPCSYGCATCVQGAHLEGVGMLDVLLSGCARAKNIRWRFKNSTGKKSRKKIHSQKADMKNGLHSPLVKHHRVKTLGTCDLQLYSYVDWKASPNLNLRTVCNVRKIINN